MQYEAFKKLVIEQLHSHFQESKKIMIQTITKNNGIKLDGLVILDREFNIAPTIYLNYYFQKFQKGTSFSEVFQELLNNYDENRPISSINVTFFTDFEKVQHRIVYKIINQSKNKELLKTVPNFNFLDLSIVFYCLVHTDENGNASILINNQHMARWNTSPEQLMKLACENTPRLLEYELKSMESILSEEMNVTPQNLYPMFVLTNSFRLNGACCILYKNLLRQISEQMGCDFFILPSSIHEVILLPANDISAITDLSAMVKEINASEVSEEDILSDHAYYYSRTNDCVSM
ncbi:MAG: DUF5688 family protein [Agathobacter sp.]